MLSLMTAVEDECYRDAGPAGRCVDGLCLHVDGLANTPQSLAFRSWIVSLPLKKMSIWASQRCCAGACSWAVAAQCSSAWNYEAIVLWKNCGVDSTLKGFQVQALILKPNLGQPRAQRYLHPAWVPTPCPCAGSWAPKHFPSPSWTGSIAQEKRSVAV